MGVRLATRSLFLASTLAISAAPTRSTVASAQEERPTVTLVAPEDEALLDAARAAELPVTLRVVARPTAASEPPDDGESGLFADVRSAYVNAEVERCLERLGPESHVHEALGEGRAELATRLSFWRAACTFAAGDPPGARRVAERMATLRMTIPPEVELASPELERLLADAYAEVGSRAAVEVRVEATRRGTVLVDARDRCPAPCTLALPPGEHVVRFEGPGATPTYAVARWPREVLRLEPTEASPELAASQWTARLADGASPDDAISLALLARALRSRRLIWLERAPRSLRGALVVDGEQVTRAEHEGALDAAESLLRDLLVRGQVVAPPPPLWRRAGFWIGVVLAAGAAATVAALVARDPPRRTVVGF
ncbi:MAG: hypothetical protein H6723_12735 [Sandaracinus sp.]|nr:hypothetical protein [Sandaracinus sp.]